jgi:hypothetical protein
MLESPSRRRHFGNQFWRYHRSSRGILAARLKKGPAAAGKSGGIDPDGFFEASGIIK